VRGLDLALERHHDRDPVRAELAQPRDSSVKWADEHMAARRVRKATRAEEQGDLGAGVVGSIDAIVLDYVGHASAAVQQARARATTHVIDLGECGAEAAAEALAGRLVNQAVAAR
jgi:hypothetical protein